MYKMDINKGRPSAALTWLNTRTHQLSTFKYTSLTWIKLFVVALIAYLFINHHNQTAQSKNESFSYINSPKINDIYFLDFRLLSDTLRPNEKYRLAKVVDITGNIVTLQYGNLFYLRQHALIDSIRYGQLRYRKYFETKRYDFTKNEIKSLWQSGAVYLVKRPVLDQLFGNFIRPDNVSDSSDLFIPGKRENLSGSSFLASNHIEDNLSQAFNLFTQSAQLGYAKGQVNLAQMYLNAQHTTKDLQQALYWLKQAALQSDKTAILKYVIVCKQVVDCDIASFYQELITSGVNIKVREMEVKLSSEAPLPIIE